MDTHDINLDKTASETLHCFADGRRIERAAGEINDESHGYDNDRVDNRFYGYDRSKVRLKLPSTVNETDIVVLLRSRSDEVEAALIVHPRRYYDVKKERVVGYQATEPHYLPYKKPLLEKGEITAYLPYTPDATIRMNEWLVTSDLGLQWGQSHHSVWRLRQLTQNPLSVPMAGKIDYHNLISSIAEDAPRLRGRTVFPPMTREYVVEGLRRIREEALRHGDEVSLSGAATRYRESLPKPPRGFHAEARARINGNHAFVREVIVEYYDRWFAPEDEGVAPEQLVLI